MRSSFFRARRSITATSCDSDIHSIKIAGREEISGSQRIGWDALLGKFRSWIFDSEGGHSEGYWHRDGDNWVLKATGVTASTANRLPTLPFMRL